MSISEPRVRRSSFRAAALGAFAFCATHGVVGETLPPPSPHDVHSYELVWNEPGAAPVSEREGITYARSGERELRLDAVHPADASETSLRPAVLFLAAQGDDPKRPLRKTAIYRSWMRTVAQRGYVGLMGEADAEDVAGSLASLLRYIREHSAELFIDENRIAAFAASSNVRGALPFLMNDPVPAGVVAAVLFYGTGEASRIRPDLPVFLAIAGKDDPALVAGERNMAQSAAKASAPWIVAEGPRLPHAFDVLDSSEESRALIGQALAFLDLHLAPLPAARREAPERAAARLALADLFGQEFESAHEYYNSVAEGEGRTDPQLWANIASSRQAMGLVVGEAVAREQLLLLAPGNVANRLRYIFLASSHQQWREIDRLIGPLFPSFPMEAYELGSLGVARLNLGRPAEAVAPLEEAVRHGGDAALHYNLACAYARTERTEEALAALSSALDHGFSDISLLDEDSDLAAIRAHPRFTEIRNRARSARPPG